MAADEHLRAEIDALRRRVAELEQAERSEEAARRTTEALHLSEATAGAIVEAASEAIVIVGDDGRIHAVNGAATRMFGYPRQELVGLPVETLVPGRFRGVHARHRADYFAAPRVRPMGRGLDLTARRKDATEFPVEISLSFVDTEAGRFAVVLITDITDRKRVDRQLRTQFAVTQALVERPPLRDATPRLLQALCECLGWDLGELWLVDAGANVLRWEGAWHSPTLDAADFTAYSRQLTFAPAIGIPGSAWASGEPMWVADVTDEVCFLRAAAARQVGLRAACAFPIRNQEHITGVVMFFCREFRQPDAELSDLVADVANRIGLYVEFRRAQEEIERQRELLYQQERLSALGALAAGLAHEINNPMGIIATRLELMLTETEHSELPAGIREDLEVLQRHVHRVGRIAQGLLLFGRQAPRERAPTDLNRIVEETLLLVEAQMRRAGIEIHRGLDQRLPSILGDMSALQQVVLNLLTNAREAMTGQGTVTLATRHAPEQPGWIQLLITDTGPGIPPDALSKIFDPFFTTKPQGTGLGLSVSYGIVQDHRGTVEVESQSGRGTTFILSFPVA
jgi:PAS domain S-box-containing protein